MCSDYCDDDCVMVESNQKQMDLGQASSGALMVPSAKSLAARCLMLDNTKSDSSCDESNHERLIFEKFESNKFL